MNKRPKPPKPERNPSHVVLPGKGLAPYRVEEQLPRDKECLELTVGGKFLAALRRFKGIELDGLVGAAEPADLECRSPDGSVIKLQIVEAVDQKLRELRDMRTCYRNALEQMLGEDLLRLFSGCRITLVDVGDPPYLPHVKSVRGRECLCLLATHIRNVGAKIQTLEPEQGRVLHNTRTKDPERTVGVVVERLGPAGDAVPFEFSWSGGYPSYRSDVHSCVLPAAIQSKINKHYDKPKSGTFWLLAYSVESPLSTDDLDIAESQRRLEESCHPFDKVWFFYPMAGRELAPVQVWPTKRFD